MYHSPLWTNDAKDCKVFAPCLATNIHQLYIYIYIHTYTPNSLFLSFFLSVFLSSLETQALEDCHAIPYRRLEVHPLVPHHRVTPQRPGSELPRISSSPLSRWITFFDRSWNPKALGFTLAIVGGLTSLLQLSWTAGGDWGTGGMTIMRS